MNKQFIRCLALCAFTALTASACQSMRLDDLKTISAGHTGCTPDQIAISNDATKNFGTDETWNATCSGKVYLCSGASTGYKAPMQYSCAPVAN